MIKIKKIFLFLMCFVIAFSFPFKTVAYAEGVSSLIVDYSSLIPDTGTWVYNQTNTLNMKYSYNLSGSLYNNQPYFFITNVIATNTTNYNNIINYYNNIDYTCNLLGFLSYDVITGQSNYYYITANYKPIAVGSASNYITLYHTFDINSLKVVAGANSVAYTGDLSFNINDNSFNVSFDNIGVIVLGTSYSSLLNFVVGGGVYPLYGGLGSLFFDFSSNGIEVLDLSLLNIISIYDFHINDSFNLTTYVNMDYTSQYYIKTFAFYGFMQCNYLNGSNPRTLNNVMSFRPILKDTFNNKINNYNNYSSSMVLNNNNFEKVGSFVSRDDDFIIDSFIYKPTSFNLYTNTGKAYSDLKYLSFTTGFNSSLSQYDINSFWGSFSDLSKGLYKDVAWYDIFGHLYNFLIYLIFDMPIFSNVFKIFGYFVYSFVELISYVITSFSSVPFLFPLLFCFILFSIFVRFLF